MRLLPLTITARAASWRLAAADPAGGQAHAALARDARTCRFCGLAAGRWAEVFHLDGDHAHDAPDNLAAACPHCHACQHLGRETAGQEYLLVWLPELTQAALNHLARGVHRAFHDHGEAPCPEVAPSRDTPRLRSAYTAYRALAARAALAEQRLGTSSPRVLGEALLGLSRPAAGRAPALVDGLRLLPRGRLIRGGADVYPECLKDWDEADAPPEAAGAAR